MSRWTKQEIESLEKYYQKKPKEFILSKLPSRKWPQIYSKAYQLGLKRDNLGNTKYTINEDFFKEWNEKSAWVLGFLTTDGHIASGRSDRDERNIQVEISIKDIDILEKIKEAMDFTGPVHVSKRDTCRIYISNKTVVEDLISLGMDTGNRKLTQSWPSNIPENMIKHYIRGVIDADGSYYYDSRMLRMQLLGNFERLQEMVNVFNELGVSHSSDNINHRKKYGKGGADVYVVRYSQGRAMTIIHWLYKDSTIYSQRKLAKIDEAMEKLAEVRLTSKNIGAFLKLRELLENMDTSYTPPHTTT